MKNNVKSLKNDMHALGLPAMHRPSRAGACFALVLASLALWLVPCASATTNAPTLRPQESTWRPTIFASMSYDKQSKILTLTFHSGYRYKYYHVPAEVYTCLEQAKSQGRYFNDHIRRRYVCRRVDTVNRHQQAYNRSYNKKGHLQCPYDASHWSTRSANDLTKKPK